MKKLFAIALFALPFTALKAQSTVTYDVQEGKKGYGRIEAIHADGFVILVNEQTGIEFFVHVTGLSEEIRENDHVIYDVNDGKTTLIPELALAQK